MTTRKIIGVIAIVLFLAMPIFGTTINWSHGYTPLDMQSKNISDYLPVSIAILIYLSLLLIAIICLKHEQ